MQDIKLRRATIHDVDVLREIGVSTFRESFGDANEESDMNDYLAKSFSDSRLMEELGNAHSEFHFAMLKENVIGYLKINTGPAQSELIEEGGLEIERIYVSGKFHGSGVGQILFEKALQLARDYDLKFIWLGVWEKNPRAIRFYEKNGFKAFDEHTFILGKDVQTDIMMRMELDR